MKTLAPIRYDSREYDMIELPDGACFAQHYPCGELVVRQRGILAAVDWAKAHKCNEE